MLFRSVATTGRRKTHIPTPLPKPCGAAPSAESAAMLTTEPRRHTTRGEAQESKARSTRSQGEPLHPPAQNKTRQIVGEVVTQSARSRGRNRCPHPSPARQRTQAHVASTECGNITLTVSQGWRGYIKSSTQAGVRDCTVKPRPRASIGRTYASKLDKRIHVGGFAFCRQITTQLAKPGIDPHVFI